MISIVTVNWNAHDFAKILVDSAEAYTSRPYEIIVVDNSSNPKPIPGVVHLPQNENIGHGQGLNIGAQYAQFDLTLFLDIDCHFLRPDWVDDFVAAIKNHDVVAGRGVPAKPIRPACMVLRTSIAKKYDWRSTPGYQGHRITPEGFDVAISAYHAMIKDGLKIGFFESCENRYGTLNGEEWIVNDQPSIYHHWHGTSVNLPCRQADFPGKDLPADKQFLLDQLNSSRLI